MQETGITQIHICGNLECINTIFLPAKHPIFAVLPCLSLYHVSMLTKDLVISDRYVRSQGQVAEYEDFVMKKFFQSKHRLFLVLLPPLSPLPLFDGHYLTRDKCAQ